jgi:hypothetical protein
VDEYAHEVMDPCSEACTSEMTLYKVDVNNQKRVEISCSDLQGHALFLGFNSALFLSTKDFPRPRPNCAYLTDDYWEQLCMNMFSCRDVGIWNFETEKLESLIGDVQSVHPWLNWPPPIWIKPSLSYPCKKEMQAVTMDDIVPRLITHLIFTGPNQVSVRSIQLLFAYTTQLLFHTIPSSVNFRARIKYVSVI